MKIFTLKEYLPYFTATLIGAIFGILILTAVNKNDIPTEGEIISKNLIGNSFNELPVVSTLPSRLKCARFSKGNNFNENPEF